MSEPTPPQDLDAEREVTHPDDTRRFLAARRAIAMSIVAEAEESVRYNAFRAVVADQPSYRVKKYALDLWDADQPEAVSKWLIPLAEQIDREAFLRLTRQAGVSDRE